VSKTQPFLTVLVPAFDEEAGLARDMETLLAGLERLGTSYEVIIVDDASRDQTGLIADDLAVAHTRVRVVHHASNQGIGGGFVSGIAAAAGEWLILIPADLAMDVSELSIYLEAAREADVVVGVRSDRGDYSAWRRIVSWVNIRLIQLLFGMRERQFNYISMYRLAVLRQMRIEYWQSAFFHAETLIKAKALGYRLVEVEIGYVPRATGRATGARPRVILRTLCAMLSFWLRWRLGHTGQRGWLASHG
jgi:glycosyltransferase involved in cell wall biosynthesis